MNKYTVILLYPDYCTGDYGADIYVDHVIASTPETATVQAQLNAVQANGQDVIYSPDDMRMILVFTGHHTAVADATTPLTE